MTMSDETYFRRLAILQLILGIVATLVCLAALVDRKSLRTQLDIKTAVLCQMYYAEAQTGQDTIAVIRDRGCEVPGVMNPVWSCGDTTGCFAPVPEDGR